MRRISQLLIAAIGLASSPALGGAFTSPADIDAAAARFLGAEPGAEGGAVRRVDPRLKLAACEQPLDVAWHGTANTSLQVSCPPRGWRVFVAVGNAPHSAAGLSRGPIVQRGETVSVVYEGPGFVLSRQGEAMEPGADGQWIKIKPVGDKTQPIRGQVVGPATVRVSAG